MIDSHIHHAFQANDLKRAQQELDLLKGTLVQHGISRAVLHMIYDGDISAGRYKLDFGNEIVPSCMLDPRTPEKLLCQQLSDLRTHHVRLLKLLPYEQHILREDYPRTAGFAELAQEHGMALTIDASYGSRDLYNTNGVELAAYILERGFTNPLIIAHGGMVRVLDTFSLMREYDDLYMDISFTLPFWRGSSVIQDYAFVLKSLSFARTFYGSDYPYYSFEDSMKAFQWFCETYQFSPTEQEKLLHSNFEAFERKFLRNAP